MITTGPTELERRALDAMHRAKWIRDWLAVDGKDVQIVWEEKGSLAAFWLQIWEDDLCVLSNPFNPILLSWIAAEAEFQPKWEATLTQQLFGALRDEGLLIDSDRVILTSRGQDFFGFYVTLIMDLDLAGDQDAVFGLFSVCMKWAQEPQKLLRPLPYYVEREIQQGRDEVVS